MVNYNTKEQVYNVRENDALAAQVASVICVLVQRGLLIAGFSVTNELLTMQYNGYNRNRPVWELDFFEHIFANEDILAEKGKIKGVFISSDKNLVVPEELFNEEEAILDFAHEQDADLIVMATHQRRGLAHMLLGSITEDTVNHSDIPVLSLSIK
jgi:hypothetical protein